MSFELWTTIATVGTFVVVAVTAIAALIQLRHIQRANQVAGLACVLDMLQDPGVRDLINYVRHDLKLKMEDEEYRKSLVSTPVDRRKHVELYLCDMYNHIGSFVRSGLIDEHIFLQTEWYNVNLYWGLLQETVRLRRTSRNFVFENFEWLASRAKAWIEEHPQGDFPAGYRRLIEREAK